MESNHLRPLPQKPNHFLVDEIQVSTGVYAAHNEILRRHPVSIRKFRDAPSWDVPSSLIQHTRRPVDHDTIVRMRAIIAAPPPTRPVTLRGSMKALASEVFGEYFQKWTRFGMLSK